MSRPELVALVHTLEHALDEMRSQSAYTAQRASLFERTLQDVGLDPRKIAQDPYLQ